MEMTHCENWITGCAVCFLKTQYSIPHPFSTNFVHFSHILPLEQMEETRARRLPAYKHYQYKYTF
jgi:hypothetical protein